MPKLASLAYKIIRSTTKSKILTTYSFPAGSSTWTAPAGVTTLTSAIGKGSDAVAGSWYYGGQSHMLSWAFPSSDPGYFYVDWSDLYTPVADAVSRANASGSGWRLTDGYQFFYRFNSTDGLFTDRQIYYYGPASSGAGYYLYGTVSVGYSGNARSNGTVTADDANAYSQIYGQAWGYSYGYSYPTTGFGLNFSGGSFSDNPSLGPSYPGTASPATLQTYNTVSVSPGTQYSINNNGSLTIQYYV
jgi:hypothetical protein